MSILVGPETKLVVTGLTGREGTFHAGNNRRYGTDVVAGVTPGKGGQDVEGIPVFNTFHDAVAETGANTAMIFVPPRFAADSILEAEDAGVGLIICITEGIPAHDELRVYNHLATNPTLPDVHTSPGMIPTFATPGEITPGQFGPTSVVSVPARYACTAAMSRTGMPSVMQTVNATPASAASKIASAANRGGTKIIDVLAPVSATASETVSNTGMPSTSWPPLPGVTPATTDVP